MLFYKKNLLVAFLIFLLSNSVFSLEFYSAQKEKSFINASAMGNLQKVKQLLKDKVDINCVDKDKKTALIWAAYYGYSKVVKLLIKAGANLEITDDDGKTAFHRACQNGKLDTVKILIKAGAHINSLDKYKNSPLIWAAYKGHSKVVELLIKAGANLELKDNKGQTAFHWACEKRHLETVKILIKAGAHINSLDKDKKSPLILAAYNGHSEVVKLLIKAGANLELTDNHGKTAFHWACQNGNLETVKILIKAGAHINSLDKYKNSPLILAAYNGYVEIVKLLVDSNANLKLTDYNGKTAFHLACQNGKYELVKYFLSLNSYDINEENSIYLEDPWKFYKNKTPLMLATLHGNLKTIKLLIEAGADISKKNFFGETALSLAVQAKRQSYEKTVFLIKAGANVNALDSKLCSALHYAVEKGRIKIIKLLLKNHANIHFREYYENRTALHLAASQGNSKALELLLKAGADINAESAHKNTALMMACKEGKLETVKVLLKYHADINKSNYFQQSAISMALGYPKIVKLLLLNKVNLNIKDYGQSTLLHLAVRYPKSLKILLDLNYLKLEAKDKKKRTPLMYAVSLSKLESVKLLVNAGANIKIVYLNGQNLLNKALSNMKKDPKLIAFLKEQGIHPNEIKPKNLAEFKDLLLESSYEKTEKLLKEYPDYVKRMQKEESTPLMQYNNSIISPLAKLILTGKYKKVKLLLKYKINVNFLPPSIKRGALLCAVAKGNLEMVKLLIKHKAKIFYPVYYDGLEKTIFLKDGLSYEYDSDYEKKVFNILLDPYNIITLKKETKEDPKLREEVFYHVIFVEAALKHQYGIIQYLLEQVSDKKMKQEAINVCFYILASNNVYYNQIADPKNEAERKEDQKRFQKAFNKKMQFLKWLLKAGADINYRCYFGKNTAFMRICHRITKLYSKEEIKKEVENSSTEKKYFYNLEKQNQEARKLFFFFLKQPQLKLQNNKRGYNAFFALANGGSLKFMKLLLKNKGATKLYDKSYLGETVLKQIFQDECPNLKLAKFILNNYNFNIYHKDKLGNNYLNYIHMDSSKKEIVNAVDFLLQKGLSIYNEPKIGHCFLFRILPSSNESSKFLDKVFQYHKKINFNHRDKDGNTYLHMYLKYRALSILYIKMLLEKGAQFTARNNKGDTPFQLMMQNIGYNSELRFNVLRYLLKTQKINLLEPDSYGFHALDHVLARMEFTLDEKDIFPALWQFFKKKGLKERILNDKKSFNERLLRKLGFENVRYSFFIFNRIIDFDKRDKDSKTLLINTIEESGSFDYDMHPVLFDKKIDINAVDKNKKSVLMYVAQHLTDDDFLNNSFERYLKKGAKLNMKDKNLNTVLHYASLNEYKRICKYLIEQKNFNPRQLNKYKENPLLFGIKRNFQIEVFAYFMEIAKEKKLDLNAQNDKGETALILLVKERQKLHLDKKRWHYHQLQVDNLLYAIQCLLERGVDISLKDKSNKTALDYAKEYKHPFVLKLLLNYKNREM